MSSSHTLNGDDEDREVRPAYDNPQSHVYIVQGAGMMEVNGIYQGSDERSDGSRTYVFATHGRSYVLYRYRDVWSNLMRWRLALKIDDRHVSQRRNSDFYVSSISPHHVHTPDASQWSIYPGVPGPAPQVEYIAPCDAMQ